MSMPFTSYGVKKTFDDKFVVTRYKNGETTEIKKTDSEQTANYWAKELSGGADINSIGHFTDTNPLTKFPEILPVFSFDFNNFKQEIKKQDWDLEDELTYEFLEQTVILLDKGLESREGIVKALKNFVGININEEELEHRMEYSTVYDKILTSNKRLTEYDVPKILSYLAEKYLNSTHNGIANLANDGKTLHIGYDFETKPSTKIEKENKINEYFSIMNVGKYGFNYEQEDEQEKQITQTTVSDDMEM